MKRGIILILIGLIFGFIETFYLRGLKIELGTKSRLIQLAYAANHIADMISLCIIFVGVYYILFK